MTEYETSCLGKTRFLTRYAAKTRANAIRRTGGPTLRPYECTRYCGLWHLGHRPGHATYLRGGPNNPPRTGAHPVKALTIRQPWAGAIVHQTKRVENRTWKLPAAHHRTRILIHAGAQLDPNAEIYGPNLGDYSAIIGIAAITGCHWSDDGTCCGPWGFANTYHWELADVTALPKPVPAKGALGFWTPPADVLDAVLVQQAVTS